MNHSLNEWWLHCSLLWQLHWLSFGDYGLSRNGKFILKMIIINEKDINNKITQSIIMSQTWLSQTCCEKKKNRRFLFFGTYDYFIPEIP